ncbi:MAG: sigma-70 family RNA polymerase sigma factor [Gemmataceae bacterium]
MSEHPSTILQRHIERFHQGDHAAREELFAHAYGRLQRLAERMLGRFPRVRRWEDFDDVTNNAALRLWKALEDVKPATARDFYRLAALQIRRELLDLARRHQGPHGLGANHESVGAAPGEESGRAADPADQTHDPGRLAEWTDFHHQVEQLPEEERETFDLLFYEALPQADAAQVLGISEATLRRRWLSARLRLQEQLQRELPQ